ncbi:MAG TPA: FtsK/SpoIIIE domain-containing protein [Candidatus Thiothrix moscowensis]|uniref:FtsK/SpoIIIE domain-containing protein n=1 Tax=unclassified Thiothrix TaxID=2636184 RepID=UPI0025E044DB|nr:MULTISPECIES: FtsK/SpoIIIE domain-containing protein [unclassified Thiothrix]HRJ52271.1 FtsK/SpoIIIE domain-containing protein [Candidatus Thiothrix moscowensis]HRJ92586.1 FtsK/SpoIIIE domain-containing protein [Candidatus Thiothrix moscowensis]
MATLTLPIFSNARRRQARASKQRAVAGNTSSAPVKPAAQRLTQQFAWVRHVSLPHIRPELVLGTGIGLAATWGVLEAWDAAAPVLASVKLPVPTWLQPVVLVAGDGTGVGIGAGLYGLQWAIRTNIQRLSAAIGYAIGITVASLPVLEVCGFDGGELGRYALDLLLASGAQPAWIAAAGTAIALGASIRMGDPLSKLAGLFDLIGAGVTALLPSVKAAPQEKALPVPVTKDSSPDAALKAKMQAVLNARKLDYISVQQVAVGPVLTTFMVKVPLDKDLKTLTREAQKIASVFRSSGSVGITEHVRGTDCGAIEVPNAERGVVKLADLMDTASWQTFNEPLALLLGVDTVGNPKMASLPDLIHLLIAGTTGMGKSVLLNTILVSMMAKSTPDMLRIRMVDPKQLELGLYEGSPFVEGSIITDMKNVRPMLEELIDEMEHRYGLMRAARVRNIAQYNAKRADAPLPYAVALWEEFADFIMLDRMMGKMTKVMDEDGREVEATEAEDMIIRLAQKSRAAGIHLMPTTQRPEKDVVTPLIRSNIPSRIALHVMSKGDSKIILDREGAEQLLDKGDAYGLFPGCTELQRFHGALVTEREVEAAVAGQRKRWPEYCRNGK